MAVTLGVKIPAAMVSAALGDAYYDQGNAMLRMLQTLVQPNVISMSLTTPPGTPSNADTYIVGASATGAWSGKDKNIAYWSADPTVATPAWEFYVPVAGWVVANQADGFLYIYTGSAWLKVTPTMTATAGGFTPTPPNDATMFLDGTANYSRPVPRAVAAINNQTANYTLALGDEGALVRMNVGSSNTCTVPPHSSVAFPVGTVITVRQIGAGVTTIAQGAGVTVTSPASLALARQYGTVQLIQVATDTWDLVGDVT